MSKVYRPRDMMELYGWCRNVILGAGYCLRDVLGELNCVAVRGLYPVKGEIIVNGKALPGLTHALEELPNRLGAHNDVIIVFGHTLAGDVVARTFPASVDPGERYTVKPLHPAKGCAHLKDGQWPYKKGMHRGYPAFNQAGPVTVWRDRDRDAAHDTGEIEETGWYGINIHASSRKQESDPASAGCQVIEGGRYGDHWRRFYRLITEYGLRVRDTFDYTLVDVSAWQRHYLVA